MRVKTLTEILGKKKRYAEDEDCLVLGIGQPEACKKSVTISLVAGKDNDKDILAKRLRSQLRPANSTSEEHYNMYRRAERPVLDSWERNHLGIITMNPECITEFVNWTIYRDYEVGHYVAHDKSLCGPRQEEVHSGPQESLH